MAVEWDEAQRRSNLNDHGVDFEDAALIFENPVLEAADTRADYGETRYRALGHVDDEYFMFGVEPTGDSSVPGRWTMTEREDIKRYSLEGLRARRAQGKTKTRPDALARPVDAEFWASAHVVMPPPGKTSVHLRVDSDVLEWFRAQGKGHLSRMNAVLRSFMEAHKERAR